MIKTNI